MSKVIGWDRGLPVAANGRGLVGHAGAVHLRASADRTGLTGALSAALGRAFDRRLDGGVVFVEVAMMIALGGSSLSDIRIFGHTRAVFGAPVSDSTVWRALDEIGPLSADRARARTRRQVWRLLAERPEGLPQVAVAGKRMNGWTVLDVDASLVAAASDKDLAAATRKKGRGFHPILMTCDNTHQGEPWRNPDISRSVLLFELGPYPGDGGDVLVIKGIDEIFLHCSFERSPDCLGELPSGLGEADERYPSVALVGVALEVSRVDEVLDQP